MSSPDSHLKFSPSRFLEDLEKGSKAIEAPYSEETTKAILQTYDQHFHKGAIQLRATSRPGDPLMYRLFTRRPINATDIAVKSGFLEPGNAIAPLVDSWKSKWDEAYEQLDFAADKGVISAFLFLGSPRKLDELFDVPLTPASMKALKPAFHELGLDLVQCVGAEYLTQQISFYFIAKGPLTEDLAARFCALAGAAPPSKEMYDDMRVQLGTDPFFFMATVDPATGKISEVQFYIFFPIELRGEIPDVGERLTASWDVDTYEEEEMDILGWCFSEGGEYLCAYRGYCGGLRELLRNWKIMSVD